MDELDANGFLATESEFDALNDETFGDDDGEIHWDATDVDIFNMGESETNGINDIVRRTVEVLNEMKKSPEPMRVIDVEDSPEEDFDNENALEESISRLVMDDLDDEDEEEAMKSKLRRLGTTTNLSTYFLPPQVANKHMQWLRDTELPGQSSLLGSSVWSMHPTIIPSEQKQSAQHPSHQSSILSEPFDMHTLGTVRVQMSGSKIEQLDKSIASQGMKQELHHQMSRVQGNSDLQSPFNNFFGQGHPPQAAPASQETKNKKPVFKTVEEIERELLDGPGPPKPQLPDQSTEASGNNFRKVMTAEELERELMGGSAVASNPPAGPMSPDQRFQPNQLVGGPKPPQTPPHSMQQQPPMTPPFQNQMQQALPVNLRPPPGLSPHPGMGLTNVMIQGHPRMHPNMNMNMIAGGRQPMAQGMAGYPFQLANNLAAQLAFHQHQQQLRFIQMPPALRNRVPFMMPVHPPQMGHPLARHEFPSSPGPHGIINPNNIPFMRPVKTDDPYRGLMNEKDKQRLRNIQIIQLQNDHPYTTDYYSLMYKVRHGVSDPKQQRDYLAKLYPKKSDDPSNRNSYQPAHFENSLGKLQAVSALAPKKAIDTVIRVVDSGPTNRSGVKAYRYLLLEVEKLYECLLAIQEADIRKTLLLNADDESSHKRSEASRKVIQVLQSPEKLSEILSVKKGKMLISRLIPLMEPSVRYGVFQHMVRTFRVWAVGDAAFSLEVDKTYPFLRHCILQADMQHLIAVFNSKLDSAVHSSIILSKLGFSLLLTAFHRAEGLILETSPPASSEELEASWVLNTKPFVVHLLRHLVNSELPLPIEVSAKTVPHLKRFGTSVHDLEVYESKITQWLEDGTILHP